MAILQARMSSTRLPGKVLAEINGQPMIYWQITRILRSKSIDGIIVATSSERSDDLLAKTLENLGVKVVRGSLQNVFSRFKLAISDPQPDYFLRLTADCPLVMSELIDQMIVVFEKASVDYLSNIVDPTFPDGLDVEIISTPAFLSIEESSLSKYELEHVTPAIYQNPEIFKVQNFKSNVDLRNRRWTVDTEEDLKFVRKVFHQFKGRESNFTLSEMLEVEKVIPNFLRIQER